MPLLYDPTRVAEIEAELVAQIAADRERFAASDPITRFLNDLRGNGAGMAGSSAMRASAGTPASLQGIDTPCDSSIAVTPRSTAPEAP